MADLSKRARRPRRLPGDLVADHPVLTLGAWARALGGDDGAARAREAARYYTRSGRLQLVTRGVYAIVPPGSDPKRFTPDPFLVARALREDAILSHHAAWDLLGLGHSAFNRVTYFTGNPRRPLRLNGVEWIALPHPKPLIDSRKTDLGVVTVDRRGVRLRSTGAERTLADGLLSLRWAGGLEEHLQCASGARDLDLALLRRYLDILDSRLLNAAVGWFLESHPAVAEGVESFFGWLRQRLPKRPLYLGPRQKGGLLVSRWNILVPRHLGSGRGKGEARA